MDYRKDLLLRTAARLYSLGLDLESTKEQIRKLSASGTSASSPELQAAVMEYSAQKAQWDELERQYLDLRKELTGC